MLKTAMVRTQTDLADLAALDVVEIDASARKISVAERDGFRDRRARGRRRRSSLRKRLTCQESGGAAVSDPAPLVLR
jgi:hypothetical protein